jgi:hypothetical protein
VLLPPLAILTASVFVHVHVQLWMGLDHVYCMLELQHLLDYLKVKKIA